MPAPAGEGPWGSAAPLRPCRGPIRIITGDVARLADFYERATRAQASWSNEDFAELRTACAALAIGSTHTVPPFAPGAARPADNRTVIIEFLADDVDGV